MPHAQCSATYALLRCSATHACVVMQFLACSPTGSLQSLPSHPLHTLATSWVASAGSAFPSLLPPPLASPRVLWTCHSQPARLDQVQCLPLVVLDSLDRSEPLRRDSKPQTAAHKVPSAALHLTSGLQHCCACHSAALRISLACCTGTNQGGGR